MSTTTTPENLQPATPAPEAAFYSATKDFEPELRHRCRNPRCRMKLPKPVANPRDAFCTKGCHNSFYRRRCLICERPMERRTETQRICGKRRCRNALAARPNLGCYAASSATLATQETPDSIGSKTPIGTDRAWHIVVGELTPQQFHCATIPDGPSCQWRGGGYQQIESRNRAPLREQFRNPKAVIQPNTPPANILGGYRFPTAPAIDLPAAPVVKTVPGSSALIATIPEDLSIPGFLKHTATPPPRRNNGGGYARNRLRAN